MSIPEYQRRAVEKYNKKTYVEFKVRIKKQDDVHVTAEQIKTHAEKHYPSVNAFFAKAAETQIMLDNKE